MRTIFFQIISVLVFSMVLAGCSDGNDGYLDPESLTGRFIDSPVSGLEYDNGDSSNLKITNSSGEFSYLRDETLTFYLGSLKIGTVSGSEIITLRILTAGLPTGDLPNAAINIGRVMLTLDVDGNPSNGIQISQEARNFAALNDFTQLDFDVLPAVFEARAKSNTRDSITGISAFEELLKQQSGEGREGKLAEVIEVEEHIKCSEQDLVNSAEPDGSCVTGVKPEISIEDVSVFEGDGQAIVSVVRSGNTQQSFIIEYSTFSASSDGSDYTPVSGTLDFPAGVTDQKIIIDIVNDEIEESVEIVQVSLDSDNDVVFIRNQANIGILDDDNVDPNATYNIDVAFVKANQTINVTEGDFGAVPVRLVIRRTGDLEPGFVTTFSTVATNSASAGSDYYSVVDNQVEFLAGQVEKVITVRIRGDKTVDPEEQFGVSLTGVSATEAVTATLDIRPVFIKIDDDDIVDLDPDKDGLNNDQEELLGTDPNDPDTDGDGANDKDDVFPLDSTEKADDDNDGKGNNADPDDDNDGSLDGDDQCPNTDADDATVDQDGCSNSQRNDADNDSVLDADDSCPLTPASDIDVDANGCGESQRDTDNDEITDINDNCPFTANPDQSNGDGDGQGNACDSDDDNDGLADESDNCPLASNSDQKNDDDDLQGNACDSDDDNDGLADEADNCPTVVNPDQSNGDGDGQGNACDSDDDNDGVNDGADVCPGTAANTDTDPQGCSSDQRGGETGGGGLPVSPAECLAYAAEIGQEENVSEAFCNALFGEAILSYENCLAVGSNIEPDMAKNFCAGLFPASELDAPLLIGSCEVGNTNQKNTLMGLAPSIAQFATVTIDNVEERAYYQVLTPLNANGEPEIDCGKTYPVIMDSHGFGGSRRTSGVNDLRQDGYVVISIDQRGHGQSGGPITVMDPKGEGVHLAAILDKVEATIDYVAYDEVKAEDDINKPQPNLTLGAVGSSYGGGYQFLLLNTDPKQRMDAMFADITWHDLRNSLNPGDTVKSLWDLALVGGGESSSQQTGLGNANDNQELPRPDNRGLHPFIKETLARGLAFNDFPVDSLDYFRYHSPSYWCEAAGLPSMSYKHAGRSPIPVLSAEVYDGVVVPESVETKMMPRVKAWITQGMPDTLFNFNEAWWNYQCLSANDSEVYLTTHNGGHAIPYAQAPDDVTTPVGGNSCSTNRKDWFSYALRGNESAKPDDDICMALGADGDEAHIPASDFLAPQMQSDGNGGHTDESSGYTLANFSTAAIPSGPLAVTTAMGAVPAPRAVVTLNPDSTHPELILAGIAMADITVSSVSPVSGQTVGDCEDVTKTLRTGCDSIIYVGLGKRGALEGQNWKLIDDQLVPIRGLGEHKIELVGVAERLAAGEDLFLLFYGSHVQFFGSTSRDATIPLVNVTGEIKLPLYTTDNSELVPFQRDWSVDDTNACAVNPFDQTSCEASLREECSNFGFPAKLCEGSIPEGGSAGDGFTAQILFPNQLSNQSEGMFAGAPGLVVMPDENGKVLVEAKVWNANANGDYAPQTDGQLYLKVETRTAEGGSDAVVVADKVEGTNNGNGSYSFAIPSDLFTNTPIGGGYDFFIIEYATSESRSSHHFVAKEMILFGGENAALLADGLDDESPNGERAVTPVLVFNTGEGGDPTGCEPDAFDQASCETTLRDQCSTSGFPAKLCEGSIPEGGSAGDGFTAQILFPNQLSNQSEGMFAGAPGLVVMPDENGKVLVEAKVWNANANGDYAPQTDGQLYLKVETRTADDGLDAVVVADKVEGTNNGNGSYSFAISSDLFTNTPIGGGYDFFIIEYATSESRSSHHFVAKEMILFGGENAAPLADGLDDEGLNGERAVTPVLVFNTGEGGDPTGCEPDAFDQASCETTLRDQCSTSGFPAALCEGSIPEGGGAGDGFTARIAFDGLTADQSGLNPNGVVVVPNENGDINVTVTPYIFENGAYIVVPDNQRIDLGAFYGSTPSGSEVPVSKLNQQQGIVVDGVAKFTYSVDDLPASMDGNSYIFQAYYFGEYVDESTRQSSHFLPKEVVLSTVIDVEQQNPVLGLADAIDDDNIDQDGTDGHPFTPVFIGSEPASDFISSTVEDLFGDEGKVFCDQYEDATIHDNGSPLEQNDPQFEGLASFSCERVIAFLAASESGNAYVQIDLPTGDTVCLGVTSSPNGIEPIQSTECGDQTGERISRIDLNPFNNDFVAECQPTADLSILACEEALRKLCESQQPNPFADYETQHPCDYAGGDGFTALIEFPDAVQFNSEEGGVYLNGVYVPSDEHGNINIDVTPFLAGIDGYSIANTGLFGLRMWAAGGNGARYPKDNNHLVIFGDGDTLHFQVPAAELDNASLGSYLLQVHYFEDPYESTTASSSAYLTKDLLLANLRQTPAFETSFPSSGGSPQAEDETYLQEVIALADRMDDNVNGDPAQFGPEGYPWTPVYISSEPASNFKSDGFTAYISFPYGVSESESGAVVLTDNEGNVVINITWYQLDESGAYQAFGGQSVSCDDARIYVQSVEQSEPDFAERSFYRDHCNDTQENLVFTIPADELPGFSGVVDGNGVTIGNSVDILFGEGSGVSYVGESHYFDPKEKLFQTYSELSPESRLGFEYFVAAADIMDDPKAVEADGQYGEGAAFTPVQVLGSLEGAYDTADGWAMHINVINGEPLGEQVEGDNGNYEHAVTVAPNKDDFFEFWVYADKLGNNNIDVNPAATNKADFVPRDQRDRQHLNADQDYRYAFEFRSLAVVSGNDDSPPQAGKSLYRCDSNTESPCSFNGSRLKVPSSVVELQDGPVALWAYIDLPVDDSVQHDSASGYFSSVKNGFEGYRVADVMDYLVTPIYFQRAGGLSASPNRLDPVASSRGEEWRWDQTGTGGTLSLFPIDPETEIETTPENLNISFEYSFTDDQDTTGCVTRHPRAEVYWGVEGNAGKEFVGNLKGADDAVGTFDYQKQKSRGEVVTDSGIPIDPTSFTKLRLIVDNSENNENCEIRMIDPKVWLESSDECEGDKQSLYPHKACVDSGFPQQP